MTTIWNQLQEKSLAGKYRLLELVEESEQGAIFRTTCGAELQPALLHVIAPPSGDAADDQWQRWQATARLSHPNVLRLLDYGRTEEEGEPFWYAVFEVPDDTLAPALERGPLTAEEAHDVLIAVLGALQAVHSHGLVHSAIDAAHIVAIGDRVKLSSETLRFPSHASATADDVRALGALVYQLITGRKAQPWLDPAVSSLPEPFSTVVEHSLLPEASQRWTVTQLAALVAPLKVQLPPAAPPSAEPSHVLPPPSHRPHADSLDDSQFIAGVAHSRQFPTWILVATPLFLIALLLFFRGIHPKPAAPVPPPVVPAAQTPVAVPPAPSRNWRVVAFAFPKRSEADKKAQSINRQWSGAQAEVLVSGHAKPVKYLVALGGPMDRGEADRFLRMARDKGIRRASVRTSPQ